MNEQIIEKRWLLKKEGVPIETIDDMYHRVADTVGKDEQAKNLYYHLLKDGIIYPNSPCFTGASTPLGNMAACHVLPLVDDLGKEKNGIFDTLRNAALIQQAGGGIGFDFTPLRPSRSLVKSSGGYASGPIGFMRVFNAAFEEVAQGGVRRGANIAILRCDHPDIYDFISCKESEGDLSCFNISVAITDEMMQAVESGDCIILAFGDKVYAANPEYILKSIAEHAHSNGEPGILFIDRINQDCPFPEQQYTAVNPCGEMPLTPFSSCNLGHLDLRNYISNDEFDWSLLSTHVSYLTTFLNDVIDANKFIPAVPELKEKALLNRRIGLGIMGLADVFFALQIRYGSPKAVSFAYQLMEWIRYSAMQTSVALSAEYGPFPAYHKSVYAQGWLPNEKPEWIDDFDFDCPNIPWDTIIAMINTYGVRNSNYLTIAPTGTTGTVAGVEGFGCEPVFALSYTRNVVDGDRIIELHQHSPAFDKAMLESVRWTDGKADTYDGIPDWIEEVFVTANDISIKEHIDMQAALQVHVDAAISKTINCPSNTTVEQIEEAIMYAWKRRVKGLTFYVDQSRNEVVLERDKCPSCGENLTKQEGCSHCACGYSACSL